jgi:hypothetical protein
MSLEKPIRQFFVGWTNISSSFPFECYNIAPVQIVVVFASNSGSDDHGEDCSPGVRERKPRPQPPKSHAAKVAPPPSANGKGDFEDDRTRHKAVLR